MLQKMYRLGIFGLMMITVFTLRFSYTQPASAASTREVDFNTRYRLADISLSQGLLINASKIAPIIGQTNNDSVPYWGIISANPPVAPQTQQLLANTCFTAVQDKIAWDYQGSRRWNVDNINRLCKGAETLREPATCFQRVMHGDINWGGGTQWNWENALNLCQGTANASKTISCFQANIQKGVHWQDAIANCENLLKNSINKLVADSSTIPGLNNTVDNVIDVCWENPDVGNLHGRFWVQEAVEKSWETYADVDFVGWNACTNQSSGIRVRIKDDENDSPHVKRLGSELLGVRDGMVLNFTYKNWQPAAWQPESELESGIKIVAVHEFGHALGIAHEHNRQDCGCDEFSSQGTNGDLILTPCDADSIMNYCKDPEATGLLSSLDIKGIQQIYGPNPNPIDGPNAQLTVTNYGSYQAKFKIEYQIPTDTEFTLVAETNSLGKGKSHTFDIPANATVNLRGFYMNSSWQEVNNVTNIHFRNENHHRYFAITGSDVAEAVLAETGTWRKLTVRNNSGHDVRFKLTHKVPDFLASVDVSPVLSNGQKYHFWVRGNATMSLTASYKSLWQWKPTNTISAITFGNKVKKVYQASGSVFETPTLSEK